MGRELHSFLSKLTILEFLFSLGRQISNIFDTLIREWWHEIVFFLFQAEKSQSLNKRMTKQFREVEKIFQVTDQRAMLAVLVILIEFLLSCEG